MPRRLPPIVCIPDTTALIHLRYVDVSGRNACLWLWDEFDVKVGNQIPRELRDIAAINREMVPGEIRGKLDRSVVEMELGLARMEQCFLQPLEIHFNSNDDLGERVNTQIGLQLMTGNHARQIIFLTDELRIVRPATGFVRRVFDVYPIGLVWNSLDYLLYLFFRHRRFVYLQAEDAIRDVNRRIGGNTDTLTTRLTAYTRRLQIINTVRQQQPALWATTRG